MLATANETTLFAEPVTERNHPRVDANFMIKVLTRGRQLVHKVRDLSMTGCFILEHPGKVGHVVHLALPLPNDLEVRLVARIVRREDNGVAVEFDDLDWEEIFAFARFLHPRLP